MQMLNTKEETKNGVGIVIGRFQVPALTDGHKDLIESVIARHEAVIIMLGLAPIKATKSDPLDFEARRHLIQETYPSIKCLYVDDCQSNSEWIKKLDSQIEKNVPPNTKVMLYGSRESFLETYKNGGRYKFTILEPNKIVSGTKVREAAAVTVKSTSDFRHGAIWAIMNQYDKVYPTVDICPYALNSEGKIEKILLASKKQDLGKLRFIGGFVDPIGYDDNGEGDFYEQNARREVREETHIELKELTYCGTYQVKDFRYRSGKDRIVTTLFMAEYKSGNPTADDDIDYLEWIPVERLKEMDYIETKIVSYHQAMLKKIKNIIYPV